MEKEYKIFIYDERSQQFVDYSQYLALPFTINEKADESYDVAAFTLEWTGIGEKFRPNTAVRIEVKNPETGNLILDGNPYYMVIESDNVTKRYRGIQVFWDHEINVIERTKLLDSIYVPNISVTNPATKTIVRSYAVLSDFYKKQDAEVDNFGYISGGVAMEVTDKKDLIIKRTSTSDITWDYENRSEEKFQPYILGLLGEKNKVQTNLSWLEVDEIEVPVVKFADLNNVSLTYYINYRDSTYTKEGLIPDGPEATSRRVQKQYSTALYLYSYKSSLDAKETPIGIVAMQAAGRIVRVFNVEGKEDVLTTRNQKLYFKLPVHTDSEGNRLPEQFRFNIKLIRPCGIYEQLLNSDLTKRDYKLSSADILSVEQIYETYNPPIQGGAGTNITDMDVEITSDKRVRQSLVWRSGLQYGTYMTPGGAAQPWGNQYEIGRIGVGEQFYCTLVQTPSFEDDEFIELQKWIDSAQYFFTGKRKIRYNLEDIAAESKRKRIQEPYFDGKEYSSPSFFNGYVQYKIDSTDPKKYDSQLLITNVNIPLDLYGPTFYIDYTVTGDQTIPQENVVTGDGYKTIRDVVNKVLKTIDPSYGQFYFKETINNSYLFDALVPERIYADQNAGEILFDLGRIIKAYPVLEEDNGLRFDTLIPKDNPLYDGVQVAAQEIITSDNTPTSYISAVSNLVNPPEETKPHYSYWPAKDKFAPASGKWDSVLVTPDTLALKIPTAKSLYYLKYIKVKGCIKGKPDYVVDITNFCPEKTYYDTLFAKYDSSSTDYAFYTSNMNKCNCIYWEKGSNIIHMDDLQEQDKVNLFGDSNPYLYKLQNAIYFSYMLQEKNFNLRIEDVVVGAYRIAPTGSNIQSSVQYQFQVAYIEKFDAQIKTEKFNCLDDVVSTSVNFNQNANSPSAVDWMNETQVNLLRRGNVDQNKSIIVHDLSELPFLGEIEYPGVGKYLADDISYVFNNNSVVCALNYTKDYNKISKDVTLSKEYRQFEIYDEPAVVRNININRYFYFFQNAFLPNRDSTQIKYTDMISGNRKQVPPALLIYVKDANKNNIQYTRMKSDGTIEDVVTNGFILPITSIEAGNSIIFKTETYDNYAIAYNSDPTKNVKYYNVFGNSESSGARELEECRYVDDLGECKYISIYLLSQEGLDYILSQGSGMNAYPRTQVAEADLEALPDYYYDYIKDMYLDKDNRETLQFIYQMHFLTIDQYVKWHPAMCKYMFKDEESANSILSDGPIAIYGFIEDPLLRESLTPIELSSNNKLGEVTVDPNDDKIILGDVRADKNYDSYGLVVPKTGEILLHVARGMRAGLRYFLDPIYISYYKNKINPKTIFN